MGMQAYRSVLRAPGVSRILLLSLVIRIPLWAANVVLTLHVVTHLHASYGAAGALSAAATVALALSSPWRGQRLDKVGLRGTLTPSIVVLAVCWSIAPFVSYWPLLVLACVGGLFEVPSFTIVRQGLIHAVDDGDRRTALAVDSVMVEITFMIGPPLGVLAATYLPTQWALFGCQAASVAGAIVFWITNPAIAADKADGTAGERIPRRVWMTGRVLVVLAMSAAAVLILVGTDVGVVAALRSMDHQSWIGVELAVWGLGSAVGGIVYGALHRPIPVPWLLAFLAGATLPVILAPNAIVIGVLLFVAGLGCAPTITATVDALSQEVPERVRGEALGWHGAAMTAGGAIGAPVAGVAIDATTWHGGFIAPSLLGFAAALAGGAVLAARSRRSDARRDATRLDAAQVDAARAAAARATAAPVDAAPATSGPAGVVPVDTAPAAAAVAAAERAGRKS